MSIVSNKALVIAATTKCPPMYFAAPSETPKITGDFSSCAACNTACVHSRLLMLNCPTAYFPSNALFNISVILTKRLILVASLESIGLFCLQKIHILECEHFTTITFYQKM